MEGEYMNVHDLIKIYEALSDDLSRYIFLQRLMYSISSDKKYIRNMVDNLLEKYSDKDQIKDLMKWIKNRGNRVVVFGAGFAGKQIIETLSDYQARVEFICDNDEKLWGKERYGMEIKPPRMLLNDRDISIVIGINKCRFEVKKQLLDLGIQEQNIFCPDREWWLGDYDQYFDCDILTPAQNEVFVDGGAFDGIDSRRFAEWSGNRYCAAYVFEPDHENFTKVRSELSNLSNIFLYEKGLWDREKWLNFCTGDEENSCISNDGKGKIPVTSIDEIKCDIPISFIKMDIEGSEGRALDGAKYTISKYKPKLAICVYHKPEDIIELPLKVLEMVPNYRLYLRHYSYVETETVMYAI